MIATLRRRRTLVMIVMLALNAAVAAQVIADRTREHGGPALSSADADSSGALGLARWLESLGYRVERMPESAALDSADVLLILQPVRRFDEDEARGIEDWVRRGGVLVYSPSFAVLGGLFPSPGSDGLSERLGVRTRFRSQDEFADPVLPFFQAPRAARFRVQESRSLDLDGSWAPLVQREDRVYAATRQLERGRLYVATPAALFSNGSIRDADNATFMLNVLARHSRGGAVTFEEAHHHLVERPDLAVAMRSSPWGWGVVYATLLAFVFLLWGGRRFGPAVVPDAAPRRSAGDYIVAFAGLLQRARAAGWVQVQYAGLVRRRLARLIGVRPDLPGADLARMLAERRQVDAADLAGHLSALDGPPMKESALLGRVRAVEAILKENDDRSR
jgi:hypothetical protein